ncbi:ABC transporter substrate-binding protein [Kitasatospora saccharophila]|uniref:ABC transporter substrate-binding protein n=1 Tax=Kitasatospora saccharophila TaxID=407973 RepID=UPI00363EF994
MGHRPARGQLVLHRDEQGPGHHDGDEARRRQQLRHHHPHHDRGQEAAGLDPAPDLVEPELQRRRARRQPVRRPHPHLAGDNIKKYPNLAAIPTGAWQAGIWGDKLYGIPSFSTGFSIAGTTFYRRDLLEPKGITADQVKTLDDLMALGKELTDEKAGTWAFDDVWTYLFPFFGVPNKWKLTDGKLVHKYETPELLEALDWHYKLATAGYLHPDAIAGNNADANTRFYAGKTLIQGGGTGVWNLADHQSGTAATPASAAAPSTSSPRRPAPPRRCSWAPPPA